ncbi:MAG TPA: SseB family protein [Gallionellaceae bacterium]|nr:SseB family protein [Gallionellaceae bacterium]HQS75195.1 SseB family protein [Gallionellaceae bacterium]
MELEFTAYENTFYTTSLGIANMNQIFEPSNDLERALVAAKQGHLPVPAFMQALLSSKVFVLIDKDIGPNGIWDNSATPMVLLNSEGAPVLAMFTAPDRTGEWAKQQPRFSFGLLTDFAWLLKGIGSNVGVVINPGLSVGLEMQPSAVAQLKQGAASEVKP